MIEISHVSKRFVSDVQTVEALRDVSLTIEKGQIWGIIGFSGAGKSTLLRMVNALEVPDQGYVKLDGRKLSDYTEGELRGVRKRIGMIFQQFNLLESRTVYENIAIPLRLNHTPAEQIAARVEELLAFVELEGKILRNPFCSCWHRSISSWGSPLSWLPIRSKSCSASATGWR